MKVRITIISVLLLILSGLGILSTAYFYDEETVTNFAKNSYSKIVPVEDFKPPETSLIPPGTNVPKKVQIRNQGIECYVRVYYEFSDSKYEDVTTIDFDTVNWEKIGDYWYYKKILKEGELTPPLTTNIHFLEEVPNDFDIIVYAESVHVKDATDYKTAFNAINQEKIK